LIIYDDAQTIGSCLKRIIEISSKIIGYAIVSGFNRNKFVFILSIYGNTGKQLLFPHLDKE